MNELDSVLKGLGSFDTLSGFHRFMMMLIGSQQIKGCLA